MIWIKASHAQVQTLLDIALECVRFCHCGGIAPHTHSWHSKRAWYQQFGATQASANLSFVQTRAQPEIAHGGAWCQHPW